MSEQQTTHPRPPQATVACLIVMFGAVFTVLLMWDRIAALHTMDTREAVQKFLASPQSDGLALSVGDVLTTVKIVSMATAALGVAIAVQGYQASKRSRSARLSLTIMVAPMALLALVGDGLVSSGDATFWCAGVAAAVAAMWLGPVRLWFDGVDPATAARRPERGPGDPPADRPEDRPGWAPPSHPSPYGSVPPPSRPVPHAWAPPSTTAYDVPPPERPRRPRALWWACVLTWIGTGLASLGLVLSLAVIGSDSDALIDRMYRDNPDLADQNLSHQMIVTTLYVISGVALAAAVAAAVFAVLLFLRRRWAWYALLTSATVAALLFLLAAVSQPASLLLVVAAAATIGCLVRPEVRAWLLRR